MEILAKDEANNEVMESLKMVDSNPASNIIQNGNVDEDAREMEPQETEELLAKGSISKSLYWKYLRSGASISVILSFLCCMILGQIGSSGCDYWVGYW